MLAVLPTISSFASLVRVMLTSLSDDSAVPARREGRTRAAEAAVAARVAAKPFTALPPAAVCLDSRPAILPPAQVARRRGPSGDRRRRASRSSRAAATAADAAVAACLASCVAETVMTGLLGGGHAIYWDAAAGEARQPRLLRRRARARRPTARERDVRAAAASRSARSSSTTRSGPASCGVPGVPAGLDALWRALRPAAVAERLVEPALRLARDGVDAPAGARGVPRDARARDDDERRARGSTRPRGALLEAGRAARASPGSCAALELLADEGARRGVRRHDRPTRCSRSATSAAARHRATTSPRYEARLARAARGRGYLGRRRRSRAAGSPSVPDTLARLPRLARPRPGRAACVALVEALAGAPTPTGTRRTSSSSTRRATPAS